MHPLFELFGTSESSSKHPRLVTLGSCRSLDGLEMVIREALQEDCGGAPKLVVRGSCAHLAGVVKSISSGIEVWRGLKFKPAQDQEEFLIEERLKL